MAVESASEFRSQQSVGLSTRRQLLIGGAACGSCVLASDFSALAEQIEPPAPFAEPAFKTPPELAVRTLAGEDAHFIAPSNPIRLLHFFATWCEPCREEFASLDRLKELEPGLVSIMSVSVGEVAIRVRRFIDATAPGFAVFLDPERRTARAWGVSSLPTTFVLDARQTPRLVVERDIDWARDDVRAVLRRLAT